MARTRGRHKLVRASLGARAQMLQIPVELLDQFANDPQMSGEAVSAATPAFKRALIERMPQAELACHLDREQEAALATGEGGNVRNCRSRSGVKTVLIGDTPNRTRSSIPPP